MAVARILGTVVVILESGRRLMTVVLCPVEYAYGGTRIAGRDFDVRMADCLFAPFATVFISRPGGGKKTRLFQYVGHESPPATPVFRKIDEYTVQISVPIVGRLDCLREKWRTLRIEYDIGKVDSPRPDDRVPECSQ